jgi:hypothetical protein
MAAAPWDGRGRRSTRGDGRATAAPVGTAGVTAALVGTAGDGTAPTRRPDRPEPSGGPPGVALGAAAYRSTPASSCLAMTMRWIWLVPS